MANYFLGVARGIALANADTTDGHWCVPTDAATGDVIVLYCPRSVSASRQGVFAEAVISAPPDMARKENSLCSGYGLLYVPIKIQRRFPFPVTANDMKRDPLLSKSPFVRRNFQGTTFPLEEKLYKRISKIADAKTEQPKEGTK